MKLVKAFMAALAIAGACTVQAAPGVVMLDDGAGDRVRAYAAGPEDARAGVLIVHDYFGLSEFTKAAAERLGRLGYRAIAIDLYHGRAATTHEPAFALMQAFHGQERALTDRTLQAGLDALKRPGRRLATLGFSMGGIEALQASLNDPAAVQATVTVYGSGFEQIAPARLGKLQGALLSIAGALDQGSLQAIAQLLQRAGEVHQPLQAQVLPGVGHAYAQPLFDGGKGYSAEATRATWRAIDEFLAGHLTEPR